MAVSPSKAVQCELWKGVVQLLYFLGNLFKLTNILWVKITRFGDDGYDHTTLVTPDLRQALGYVPSPPRCVFWVCPQPSSSIGVVVILAGWSYFF